MKELQQEIAYFSATQEALGTLLDELRMEYQALSPYIYAVGDMRNDWDFEFKKRKALEAKQMYPIKVDRMKKLHQSPYFGKIYVEDEEGKQEYYIGEEDIAFKDQHLVLSWKSDYGDMYYKRLPVVTRKDGTRIKVSKTRTFEITDGKLHDFKDYHIVHEDDTEDQLLHAYEKYLSSDFLKNQLVKRNAQKLKPVLQTIDQLQNEIIRSPYTRNILVQGVSGSGKTTLGLQRLSYIIYHFKKQKITPQILAICPSELFLNYLEELIPNFNVEQITFQPVMDLMRSFLPNGLNIATSKIKDDLTYHMLYNMNEKKRAVYAEWFRYKGSKDYFEELASFLDGLKKQAVVQDFSKVHPMLSKPLMQNIYERIKNNPYHVVISRTLNYVKQIIDIKDPDNAAAVFTELIVAFNMQKPKPETVYRNFIQNTRFEREAFNLLNQKQDTWYEEDIPALIFLNDQLNQESAKRTDYNHVFVDEAQDLSYFQYYVLKQKFTEANFTIVGDINQQIFLQRGVENWKCVEELFHTKLAKLDYNYRSSKEIMDVASACLINPVYRGQGVLQTGHKPKKFHFNQEAESNWVKLYQDYLQEWLDKGESTAIITNSIKDSEEVEAIFNNLGIHQTNVISNENNKLDYSKITIISALQVKGLEFNHVVFFNPSEKEYPRNNYFSKLFYMVCSRALYSLILLIREPESEILEQEQMHELVEFEAF